MKKRFILAAFTMLFILITLSACTTSSKTVGVCMPTKSVDRWLMDGDNIKKQLEAKGYKVMLEYADYDSERQIAQIENMIASKCDAIIIAASDCYVLDDVLKKATQNKMKIIAYDRLIMDTEYVDYYCTFDNFEVGAVQAEYLENVFDLKSGKGSISMELFSGPSDDSTTTEYYDGQMSVLAPYIDSGKIQIKSGQADLNATFTVDWSTDEARARMETLVRNHYGDGETLDAVLSTNDSIALGVIDALKKLGFGSVEKPFPVITGQDCDKASVIAIMNGEQSMSMFIDTRALSTRVVELVDDLAMGKKPAINDTKRYNNGTKVVPASICKPIYVDKDNYMDVLVRSGYYSKDDLK